jgi:uncharacterized protein YbjT (DUF2867 family)
MKIAITGGAGFVGRHLATRLLNEGNEVVIVTRRPANNRLNYREGVTYAISDLSTPEPLVRALEGCHAVAHCAGINREVGRQTFQHVHVDGTANLLKAAKIAGIQKLVLVSFLRARPTCGSAYHESKWESEQLVRSSGIDYTILKCGIIYGQGDHMLSHLKAALFRFPLFAKVGLRERPIRPVPIQEVIPILYAVLCDARLSNSTIAVVGAEELRLSQIVQRVSYALDKRVLFLAAPVWVHRTMAQLFEWTMKDPLLSLAQVRILAEGVTEAVPPCGTIPADLKPHLAFTEEQIRAGLL